MPDGQRILSGGSHDGTIRVWLLDGTHKKTPLHTDHVFAVALPDNRHALSGGNDIKLFNVNDGGVLRTFKHHTGRVSAWRCCPTASIRQRLGRRDHRRARLAPCSVEIHLAVPSGQAGATQFATFTTLWKVRFGLGNSRSAAARRLKR